MSEQTVTRPSSPRRELDLYTASQWQLMWRKLRRHRLAVLGGAVLACFYFAAIFAPFLTLYDPHRYFDAFQDAPPVRVRFADAGGISLRPFVHPLVGARDPRTLRIVFQEDPGQRHYLRFFARGDEYRLLGIIRSDIHLVGVAEPAHLFLFGTDDLGRDVFSRTIFASRISLTIGLVGVAITFLLGCLLGGISGYFGGRVDTVIQRVIEFIMSIPTLPLWMALSAALPREWPQIRIYFAITVILSLSNWTGLARVVRGKLMSLRTDDYVLAAKVAGRSDSSIIGRHLLPGFLSYLIVRVTLAIPGMILGETGLSFLGLGLRPPTLSWGVLLSEAQNIRTVALHPWLLLPSTAVVVAVLAFNFVGDGLRDAADPYKQL